VQLQSKVSTEGQTRLAFAESQPAVAVASSLQVQRYKLKCAVYNNWRIIARKSHYHSTHNLFIISILSAIFRSDFSIFPAIFSAILAISTTMPYFEVKKGKKRRGVNKLPRVRNLTPPLVTGTLFYLHIDPFMSSLTHKLTFAISFSHRKVAPHFTLLYNIIIIILYNRVIIIYRQNLLPLHSLSRIFTKPNVRT
jgi:hypothetical protein